MSKAFLPDIKIKISIKNSIFCQPIEPFHSFSHDFWHPEFDIQMFCKRSNKTSVSYNFFFIIMNNEWMSKYVFSYILVSPVISYKTTMQMLSDSIL